MTKPDDSALQSAPPAKPVAARVQAAGPAPRPAAAPSAKRGEVLEYPAVTEARAAPRARSRPRHRAAVLSFLLAVAIPTVAAFGYLYLVAADQYASRVAFSIRSQENASPISFLGALSQTVSVGGTDAEIVYEFIRSQKMVEAATAALPLAEIFNRPRADVVFRLGEDRPVEDVVDYWNSMTSVSFDGATGLVRFEARAFDPESAHQIARFVLQESSRIINEISLQAREDAVSVARSVLDAAEDRLRDARRAIRTFRDAEQELDPSENARASLGLMASLREQLATAQIELDSYLTLVGPRGPRVSVLRQRIESLEQRIAEERRRLGAGAGVAAQGDGRVFSDLMGDYEELSVDLEFAQNAYVSALASFEQAQVEARRQHRFLAPHIEPTLSMEAQYPRRALIGLGVFIVLTVAWSVLLLIAYNVRDRR
jgi:capsular polysaccharide transport system permease protein